MCYFVFSLSIIHSVFIHVVVNSFLLVIVWSYFTIWMDHSLSIRLVDGKLFCLQFGAMKNKGPVNTCAQSVCVCVLLGEYLGMILVGHVVSICSAF